MPSYEPTPKRFSILSVSRSASRRNSIDEPSHPVFVNAPLTPSYSSPVDLANALKYLQHVPDTIGTEDGKERGRSRQSVAERALQTTWGHDEPIRVPAARRDSSASTRDRIALWEERSRSQSKGRSKSRARDLAAGSRISVVPEVPEIAAALVHLREKSVLTEDTPEYALKALEGSRLEVDTPTPDTEHRDNDEEEHDAGLKYPGHVSAEGQELMADPWSDGDLVQSPTAEDAVVNEADQIGVDRDKNAEETEDTKMETGADKRPQTPIRVSPEQLPTPEATPQSTQRNTEKQNHDSVSSGPAYDEVTAKTPTPPSTPVSSAPAQPLTPDTTPAKPKRRSPIRMAFGEELVPAHPLQPSPVNLPSPVAEPAYRHIEPRKDKDESDDEDSHAQTGDPKSPAIHAPEEIGSKWPSQRPMQELESRPDDDSRYHNVWRIQDYEPEFPVPAQRVTTLDADTRADFIGYPLKALPRSQLSAEAEPYKPTVHETESLYPYATKKRGGTGDFAAAIPPSPTTTYIPGERARPPRQRSQSRGPREAARYTARNRAGKHEWDAPPVMERALHAASVSVIQGLTLPVEVFRGLRDIYYPPPGRPDIVKAYPVRRRLPVRIFFPTHHDLTSPVLLPTLFTLHGGGFTVGSAADDDAWNRSFSDTYSVLVIALNYAKAPWAVFPTPLLDAEVLYHAVLNDESLPLDRMRTALCGFDAGANLALGLAQLPSVKTGYDPSGHAGHEQEYDTHPYPHAPPRSHPPPAAVISVCGILDFGMAASRKARTRPYKRQLRGPRGWGPGLDWMARLLPSSAWSYIPYGHDIADPLLSPAYASRAELPPHVFVVAAELDCLAHESWRTACAWAGRAIPDVDVLVGRRGPSRWRGCLDDGTGENGAKFGWGETHHNVAGQGTRGFEGSTRWLLVPDVVHGFDSAGWRTKYLWGDEEARMDAEMKTIAYQRELAEWLWGTVWR